jgi:hypothetical protein
MSDRVDTLVDALRDVLNELSPEEASSLCRATLEAYEGPESSEVPDEPRTLSEMQSIDVYGRVDGDLLCCAADNFVSISARDEHPTIAQLSNDPVDW